MPRRGNGNQPRASLRSKRRPGPGGARSWCPERGTGNWSMIRCPFRTNVTGNTVNPGAALVLRACPGLISIGPYRGEFFDGTLARTSVPISSSITTLCGTQIRRRLPRNSWLPSPRPVRFSGPGRGEIVSVPVPLHFASNKQERSASASPSRLPAFHQAKIHRGGSWMGRAV